MVASKLVVICVAGYVVEPGQAAFEAFALVSNSV